MVGSVSDHRLLESFLSHLCESCRHCSEAGNGSGSSSNTAGPPSLGGPTWGGTSGSPSGSLSLIRRLCRAEEEPHSQRSLPRQPEDELSCSGG